MDQIEELKNLEENSEIFTKFLSVHDRYSLSIKSTSDIYNWTLTISIGSFIWILTNFNQFLVEGRLPIKTLFISSLLFLGLSAFIFAFGRALLFFRQHSLDKALEATKNILPKIVLNKDSMTKKEMSDYVKNTLTNNIDLWFSAHNLGSIVNKPIIYGTACYAVGLVLISIYVFIFLTQL